MDCVPGVRPVICSLTVSAVAAHLPGDSGRVTGTATEHGPSGPRAVSWFGHTAR
jgi:hypothetical protein